MCLGNVPGRPVLFWEETVRAVDLGVVDRREREKGRYRGRRSCCLDVLYERRINKNKRNKGHTEVSVLVAVSYFVAMLSLFRTLSCDCIVKGHWIFMCNRKFSVVAHGGI